MIKKIIHSKKAANISFTKYRLDTLQKQFIEASKQFVWITSTGGGAKNIHMLDTIKNLHLLYLDIAAHSDALRSIEGKF